MGDYDDDELSEYGLDDDDKNEDEMDDDELESFLDEMDD